MAVQFDVIQADRDALDAEVARIRAEGDLALAVLALQRAAGQTIEP
jgi:outer membrane protein TolC